MEIKLYNSLTRQIEVFTPIKKDELSIYVCGPTVYNDPHIGNMRPVVFFDTLCRFFTFIGYNVKFVSNYTDVDDKIIAKAINEHTTEKVITDHYIKVFQDCLEALNVRKAYQNPRVTEYMPQIISYIDGLVEKKAAYVVDGEVFFDVKSDDDYGCLSNTNIDELISGARIETNSKKKSPLDFLLWKKTDDGIKWQTKWCEGRPGRHTECCVMIDSIFNGVIDIHGGGMDLKFPHHENEIAQAMAMHHNHIAHYWMHNAMMNIDGNKMSKSLGNVIKASDAIDEYGGDLVRLILINAPYRSIINFTDKTVQDNKSILQKLDNCYRQLNLQIAINNGYLHGKSHLINDFLEALASDINVSNAVTYMLEVIKNANMELRKSEIDLNALESYFYALTDMVSILGLSFKLKRFNNEEISLYNEYTKAKKEKNFARSDELRNELIAKKIM
jgi:cysteinyl-tRNA synthetase